MYRVTMEACIAGNPHKAWRVRLPAGEYRVDDPLAPDREPPDDVWEDQSHDFDTIDAARDFIRGLPAETTTHVKLYADDELIYVQDADAEHLDHADAGVAMPHTITSANPLDEDDTVPDAPPLVAPQGAQ